MSAEHTVKLGDMALTVLGDMLSVGVDAPDFTVTANDWRPVSGSDYAGQVRVISVVPSLETRVCDMQTRRMNEEAVKFGDNVVVLTISADLPYSQKKWCGAAGIERVVTLSDHKDMSFGKAFGTYISDLRLDQRSMFVIDADNKVRYAEYVPEFGDQPDYDAVLTAVRELV